MLYLLDQPNPGIPSPQEGIALARLAQFGKAVTRLTYGELPAPNAAPGPVWIRFRKENPEAARHCLEQFRQETNRQIILTGLPAVEFWLNQGADFLVSAPEFITLPALLSCLDPPMNPFLDRIPGLMFRNALGQVCRNPLTETDWPALLPAPQESGAVQLIKPFVSVDPAEIRPFHFPDRSDLIYIWTSPPPAAKDSWWAKSPNSLKSKHFLLNSYESIGHIAELQRIKPDAQNSGSALKREQKAWETIGLNLLNKKKNIWQLKLKISN